MRIGAILKDKKKDMYVIYTGMVQGLANIVYQRDTGIDNRTTFVSDLHDSDRYEKVGYCNLFAQSVPEVIAKYEEHNNGTK